MLLLVILNSRGRNWLTEIVQPLDHHIRRFDESSRRVAFLQLKFMHGIRCNNGGDARSADSKHDLGKQPVNANAYDFAGKLVATTHMTVTLAGLDGWLLLILGKEWLQRSFGNAVMSAGGQASLQLASQNPLFDRGVTDTYQAGRFPGRQHGAHRTHDLYY